MTFDRSHVIATTITSEDGKKQDVWAAQYNSAPDVGWGRSFRFTINDPRFKNGGQPAVDIEIEYLLDAWAPVQLIADTKTGSREIGSAWGGSKRWQKLSVRLDDGFFGARNHNNPQKNMPVDGFDLRINGYNNDLHIRSIRIKGYDLDNDVDYKRLLKLDGIETTSDLLLFRPNKQEPLAYRFWNIARRPVDIAYTLSVSDFNGKPVLTRKGAATIPGNERARVPFTIPTTGWKYGVYRVRMLVQEKAGKEAPKTITDRESYLGITSPTPLRKAKPGEFLYGLDLTLGSAHDYTRLLKWTQVMGVDIARGFADSGDWTATKRVLDKYAAYGLKNSFINGPDWDDDEKRRKEKTAEKAKYFEELARRFPQVTYFELGNEPDLPFFYRGPVEAYAEDFAVLSDAVKRGNKNAVVMNGGLSFAGDDGMKRSRRFVEVADASKIDAWAYHGHGPGAKSEHDALTRMQATAREFGKGDRAYIETESGVAARTPAQEIMQARTAVQKMVYAQSVGMPFLHWFRLLMFEEDYGNLRTDQEPRPAVLSYRTTVEALRGYRFEKIIETGVPDVAAYLFQQSTGNGRVCVLWTEKPVVRQVTLAVGSGKEPVVAATVRDQFGNATPATPLPDGTVQVATSENPVFLSWKTAEPAFTPARATPVLSLPPTAQIVPNKASAVMVTVRNPLGRAMKATLTTDAKAGTTPFAATPRTVVVTLKPGETKRVPLSVTLGGTTGIEWPRLWSVFVYADADPLKLTAIPATLPKENGGSVTAQRVPLRDNTLTFTRLGGTVRERAVAIVMGEVISDQDQTVKMGASADWWMAWSVNGKPVYDTLQSGNGGITSPTDHLFDVPLKKGRNVLVGKVLSGSQGWMVRIGDPEMAKRARAASSGVNDSPHLTLTLTEDKKSIARETVEVEYALPVAPLPEGLTLAEPIDRWQAADPITVLGANSVRNFYEKEPDSSRWWKGDEDLSGEAWLFATDDKLLLTVRVRDDKQTAGDALQVGVGRDEKSYGVYTVKVGENGKATVTKDGGTGDAIEATAERGEGSVTVYKMAITRSALGLSGAGDLRINLVATDSDNGKTRKQVLVWTPGLLDETNPVLWYRAALTP